MMSKSKGDAVAAHVDDDGEAAAAAHKTYRKRWLMMLLYCIASASNAMMWITFAPINTLVQGFYGINSAKVNALSIIFLAAYTPVSFVTSWVFKRFGAYRAILFAVTLDLAGGLFRFLSAASNEEPRGSGSTGFALLMLGQLMGSIAQPFFANAPALLASRWFAIEERDIAATVMSLANPVGIAVGSVLPTFYVLGDDLGVKMFDLLLVQFIIMAVIFALVLVLFADKPPTPPSLSESFKSSQDELPLRNELVAMFSNRNYLILFFSFGTGLGFFNALTTLVEQFVGKSGYTTDDAGLFSGLLIGCGIVAAIIIGLILDRTHKYNLVLKSLFVTGGFFVVLFIIVLRPDSAGVIAFTFAGMGSAMMPLLPVAFQCAAECTYPVREDISTGGLMSAGQLTGIVFIVALGHLIDRQPDYDSYVFEPAYVVVVACIGACVIGALFYRGQYLRLMADKDPLAPAETDI